VRNIKDSLPFPQREKPPVYFRSKSYDTFHEKSKIKKDDFNEDLTETESGTSGSSTSYSVETSQNDKIHEGHSGINGVRKFEEQVSHNYSPSDYVSEKSSKVEVLHVKDNVDMNIINMKQIRKRRIMLIWKRFEELYNKYQ